MFSSSTSKTLDCAVVVSALLLSGWTESLSVRAQLELPLQQQSPIGRPIHVLEVQSYITDQLRPSRATRRFDVRSGLSCGLLVTKTEPQLLLSILKYPFDDSATSHQLHMRLGPSVHKFAGPGRLIVRQEVLTFCLWFLQISTLTKPQEVTAAYNNLPVKIAGYCTAVPRAVEKYTKAVTGVALGLPHFQAAREKAV
jgi:hypothetical protein